MLYLGGVCRRAHSHSPVSAALFKRNFFDPTKQHLHFLLWPMWLFVAICGCFDYSRCCGNCGCHGCCVLCNATGLYECIVNTRSGALCLPRIFATLVDTLTTARPQWPAVFRHSYPGAKMVPKRGRQGPKDFAPTGDAAEIVKLEEARTEFRLLREVERVLPVCVVRGTLTTCPVSLTGPSCMYAPSHACQSVRSPARLSPDCPSGSGSAVADTNTYQPAACACPTVGRGCAVAIGTSAVALWSLRSLGYDARGEFLCLPLTACAHFNFLNFLMRRLAPRMHRATTWPLSAPSTDSCSSMSCSPRRPCTS